MPRTAARPFRPRAVPPRACLPSPGRGRPRRPGRTARPGAGAAERGYGPSSGQCPPATANPVGKGQPVASGPCGPLPLTNGLQAAACRRDRRA
jgi:hypothetical protein